MSSEYNGNILYVKDENGEWIPIPSIVGEKGADGEQGPVGPQGEQGEKGEQGEPGTTEWSGLDNKPFESIGTGLSVDSEGNLNAEGGVSDWSEVENKPFETLGTGLSVDGDGVLSAQGQSYTFTNGLTEDNGTVSWDLYYNIHTGRGNGVTICSYSDYNTSRNYGAGLTVNAGKYSKISAGSGSIAVGSSDANGNGISANANSMAVGTTTQGSLSATGEGSFAHGKVGSYGSITAGGYGAYAGGYSNLTYGETSAGGKGAFAHGNGVIANSCGQFVIGECNIPDNTGTASTRGTYAFIIGNGTSRVNNPSNALTVDWDGNIVCNNIPAPPSTDGTYTLQCTVTNGVPTYSWV